jgi:hypothetical protein
MKIELVVGVYADPDVDRINDIAGALERNLANSEIDKVHALIEDRDFYEKLGAHGPEIEDRMRSLLSYAMVMTPGRRMLFSDYFGYANEHLDGSIAVVANADIYFDKTIGLLRKTNLENTFVCLAKYEGTPPRLWRCYDSQDAWAFKPPIRVEADFELGRPGCDNALAYSAARAGLKILNPCLSVFAYHLDKRARKRRRDNPVDGPYKAAMPVALEVKKQ